MARSFSSRGYFLIHKVLRLEGLGSVTKKQQWKSPTHSPLYSLIMVARGRYAMVQHEQVLVSEPKPDLVHIGLLCCTVAKHLLPTVSSMYAVFVLFVQSCLKTMIGCL